MERAPDPTTLLLTHEPFQMATGWGDEYAVLLSLPQLERMIIKASETTSTDRYLFAISSSLMRLCQGLTRPLRLLSFEADI